MLTWIAYNNIGKDDVEVSGVDVDKNILGPLTPRFKEESWEEYHEALQKAEQVPVILGYHDLHQPYDVVVVTCGTPIDNNQNPDTSQVFSAIDALANAGAITDDTLLVMRSTLFPGCSRLIRKRIALHFGIFPQIVMAPERIAEGNTFSEITRIPQIIGGDTEAGMRQAGRFFSKYFGSESLVYINPEDGGTVGAELAKLMSNTYRYVNFAMGNEFAIICDENEVDFKAVRNACNYNYWRSDIAGAALNLGGPCLGKDAKTLAAFTKNAKITEAAYEVAEKTAMYFVDKHRDVLRNGIAGILGLGFKANSDNPMNSLSYKVKKQLEILGAEVTVHDPRIHNTAPYTQSPQWIINHCDVVFVMTEHDEYKNLQFRDDQIVVRL